MKGFVSWPLEMGQLYCVLSQDADFFEVRFFLGVVPHAIGVADGLCEHHSFNLPYSDLE